MANNMTSIEIQDYDGNVDLVARTAELRHLLETEYLRPATIEYLVCSDEREKQGEVGTEGQKLDNLNPIELPGGVFLVIDILKTKHGYTEEQARDLVVRAGIPIGAHDGPVHSHDVQDQTEHIAAEGCGYENKVQNAHEALGLASSASAAERREWALRHAQEGRGTFYSVHGDHIVVATYVNYRKGTSIDAPKAWAAGKGMLGCDAWALEEYLVMLKELDPQIDVEAGVAFGVSVFEKLGGMLAPGVPHIVLEKEQKSEGNGEVPPYEFA